MLRLVLFSTVAGGLLTVFGGAGKFLYTGWDLGRATVEELADNADLFRDSPADGVSIYANFKDGKGVHHQWKRPLGDEVYTDEVLDRLVPSARRFAAVSGLSDNFVVVVGAPPKRLSWTDDAAWRRGTANFAALARFAKKCGTKGLTADFEDYSKTKQFTRAADDPDYETCVKLARRRGAELFGAAFREFPEMTVLAFYFFTAEIRYVGEADPVGSMRANGDLYPAFLNGALEALPETARFIDGNEIGYRLEADRGDFWRFAEHQHQGILPLVAPELREKYRRKVGISFGQYVDSYIFENSGKRAEYYKGPVDGSRLNHFRVNLAQAAEASDEYVWLWNEYHPYVKWRTNERCADLLAKGTLEDVLPGATKTILSVRSPFRYLDRFGTEGGNLANTLKPKFWQTRASKEKGGEMSRSDFGGRKQCHVFKGVSNGCVSWWRDQVKPGECYVFTAESKGEGIPLGRCAWRRNGFWVYSVAPARLVWGEQDAAGWRRGEGLAVVPPDVDEAVFELEVAQSAGETRAYDAVRIAKVDNAVPVAGKQERLPKAIFSWMGEEKTGIAGNRLPFFDRDGVYRRPAKEIRAFTSEAVEAEIERVAAKIISRAGRGQASAVRIAGTTVSGR